MKTIGRFFILLGALIGFAAFVLGLVIIQTIGDDSIHWIGGISKDLTVTWLAIAVIGLGYAGLSSLLALLGAAFGPRQRLASLLFLSIPGFFGVIIAMGVAALLITVQPGWPRYISYALMIGLPSMLFWFFGTAFRSANPKKK